MFGEFLSFFLVRVDLGMLISEENNLIRRWTEIFWINENFFPFTMRECWPTPWREGGEKKRKGKKREKEEARAREQRTRRRRYHNPFWSISYFTTNARRIYQFFFSSSIFSIKGQSIHRLCSYLDWWFQWIKSDRSYINTSILSQLIRQYSFDFLFDQTE